MQNNTQQGRPWSETNASGPANFSIGDWSAHAQGVHAHAALSYPINQNIQDFNMTHAQSMQNVSGSAPAPMHDGQERA